MIKSSPFKIIENIKKSFDNIKKGLFGEIVWN